MSITELLDAATTAGFNYEQDSKKYKFIFTEGQLNIIVCVEEITIYTIIDEVYGEISTEDESVAANYIIKKIDKQTTMRIEMKDQIICSFYPTAKILVSNLKQCRELCTNKEKNSILANALRNGIPLYSFLPGNTDSDDPANADPTDAEVDKALKSLTSQLSNKNLADNFSQKVNADNFSQKANSGNEMKETMKEKMTRKLMEELEDANISDELTDAQKLFEKERNEIDNKVSEHIVIDTKLHETDTEELKTIKVLNNTIRNAIKKKINTIDEINVPNTGMTIPNNLNFCLDIVSVYISTEIDTYVSNIKSKDSEYYINLYSEYIKLHTKLYIEDIKNMVLISVMNLRNIESSEKEKEYYIKTINEDIDLLISKLYTKITEAKKNIDAYLLNP